MSSPRRPLRRFGIFLVALVSVLGLLFVAAGWYFSGQIGASALAVAPDEPTYDIPVKDLARHRITLEDSGDHKRELHSAMLYGLRWHGGVGVVSGPPREHGGEVTRRFEVTEGEPPAVGDLVALNRDLVVDPPPGADPRIERITYPSGNAALPAWFVDAPGDTWAVLVHGKGESPAEMVRMSLAMTRAGMPSLLISYRNDPGTPRDADGRYDYGPGEWHDLAAAVEYASRHGAHHVVLGGASMGGAVVAAYLERAEPEAGFVRGLVLDSPMLDLASTVELGASHRELPLGLSLPPALTWTAERFAGMRYGIDWSGVDYLDNTAWLSVPTLVLHGGDDRTVPLATSRSLAAAQPGLVTVRVFPGAGHVESFNTDPDRYLQDVTAFVTSLP